MTISCVWKKDFIANTDLRKLNNKKPMKPNGEAYQTSN